MKIKQKVDQMVGFKKKNKSVYSELTKGLNDVQSLVNMLTKEWADEKNILEQTIEDLTKASKAIQNKLEETCTSLRKELADTKIKLRETQEKIITMEATETATKSKQAWKWTNSTADEIRATKTFEDFKEICKRKWEEPVFKNICTKVLNPMRTGDDTVIVIGEPTDAEMTRGIQKMFLDRYPELGNIQKEVMTLKNTTVLTIGGEKVEKIRRVVKITPKDTEKHLWDDLEEVRSIILENGIQKFTTHRLETMNEEMTKKMLQCIFSATDVQITLCKPFQSPTIEARKEKKIRDYDTDAIEISKKGVENDEVLREVKNSIYDTEVKNSIKTIRSTKSGSLLIVMEKDKGKDELKHTIKNTIPGCNIREVGNAKQEGRKQLFIRGMEATVSKDDVEFALQNVVGLEETQEIEVGELRPSRNNTKSVTISATGNVIDKLISIGVTKVGLSEGRVEKRYDIVRCYRCWSFGHTAINCGEEEDRTENYYNCGNAGHKAIDCTEEQKCLLCDEKGHTAGGRGCRFKRQAVRDAKKKSCATPERRDRGETGAESQN